jgi:hypothetical protein
MRGATATSVAKGPEFRLQNPKGAAKKSRGRENWWQIFLLNLQKRAEKEPNLKTLFSGIIYGFSEINEFLSLFYPHIRLQFVRFQLIFSSRNKLPCGAEYFCLVAEFLLSG